MTCSPGRLKWCPEHKKWEHINIEGDLHIAVSEWHPHHKAHIAALIKMLPGNGGDAKCGACAHPADIVTDGLHTKFYCRFDWNQRSDEQEGLDAVKRELHDPLTEEEKTEFGIEEAK